MTTYTLRERKSLVSTFKKVLAQLPNTVTHCDDEFAHRSPYICDNIERFADGYAARNLAKDVIQERINCKFSVEQWLRGKSPTLWIEVKHDMDHNNGRKLQAYRKAWVQSLIEEFSV